jgi:hypothetical protein
VLFAARIGFCRLPAATPVVLTTNVIGPVSILELMPPGETMPVAPGGFF